MNQDQEVNGNRYTVTRERKRRKLDSVTGSSSWASQNEATLAPIRSFSRLSATPTGPTSKYLYGPKPPSIAELVATTDHYNIPSKIYRNPYYSNERDAPDRPREYAGLVFNIKGGTGIANLEEWQSEGTGSLDLRLDTDRHVGVHGWEYASLPPGLREARKWLRTHKRAVPERKGRSSQASIVAWASIHY